MNPLASQLARRGILRIVWLAFGLCFLLGCARAAQPAPTKAPPPVASATPADKRDPNKHYITPRFTSGGAIDHVRIARDQDPENIYFMGSQTAYIWNHLATGEQYEASLKWGTIYPWILKDYIKANKPIKLTFERMMKEMPPEPKDPPKPPAPATSPKSGAQK